jgi:hypothetical protein
LKKLDASVFSELPIAEMESRHQQLQPNDWENSVPLKAWTRGIPLEEAARQPLLEVARCRS